MQYQQPFSTPHPGSIQIDYPDVLNYSLLHNHVASVHACSIRNDSDVAWQRVCLRLSGDFVHPSEVVLTEVPAGQEGSFPRRSSSAWRPRSWVLPARALVSAIGCAPPLSI